VALACAVAFAALAWWQARRAGELARAAKAPRYATLPADPSGRAGTYHAAGQVLHVDPGQGRVTIAHQDIPNFMPAMTMTFRVKDPRLLDEIKPGDEVDFELEVSAQAVTIRSIKHSRSATSE
jgi:Cu/Ag efflux protein CusF